MLKSITHPVRPIARTLLALTMLGMLAAGSTSPGLAAKPVVPPSLHVVGAPSDSEDVISILQLMEELSQAANQHDIEAFLKHYAPTFVSGDNLNLEQVRHLVLDTWKSFPEIQYKNQLLEVRVHGDWATVESLDTATAPTQIDAAISDKPGQLESRSRGLLYLHRIGKTWEIKSDYTLYEEATILYGPLQNVNVTLSTPEQVFAGEPYTAKINVNLPPGSIAFATIAKELLVYPQEKPKDKFRTLSNDKDSLERVLDANASNNSEIVTATLGLTQIGQDDHERPTIELKGVATLVKRVNVIPRSKATAADEKTDALVRQSASGTIKVEPSESNEPDMGDTAPADQPDNDLVPAPEEAPQDEAPEDVPQGDTAPPADASP